MGLAAGACHTVVHMATPSLSEMSLVPTEVPPPAGGLLRLVHPLKLCALYPWWKLVSALSSQTVVQGAPVRYSFPLCVHTATFMLLCGWDGHAPCGLLFCRLCHQLELLTESREFCDCVALLGSMSIAILWRPGLLETSVLSLNPHKTPECNEGQLVQ